MTTTQKNAITGSIPTGLLVYDTTLLAINHYNGSAWSSISSAASNPVVVAINNTNSPYSLTTATDILVCTASAGGINITIPTAIGNSGKIFRLIRTDTTLANPINIFTTSSQTIGGPSPLNKRYMWTANETWNIVSDGANWQIISHDADTEWVNDGATIITATTTNPTKGTTPAVDRSIWRRNGKTMSVQLTFKNGGTGSATGSGDYLFTIPQSANISIDTTLLTPYTTIEGGGAFASVGSSLGSASAFDGGNFGVGFTVLYNSTKFRIFYMDGFNTGFNGTGCVGSGKGGMQSDAAYVASYAVPIAIWDA
jgi:hypothetical protein